MPNTEIQRRLNRLRKQLEDALEELNAVEELIQEAEARGGDDKKKPPPVGGGG